MSTSWRLEARFEFSDGGWCACGRRSGPGPSVAASGHVPAAHRSQVPVVGLHCHTPLPRHVEIGRTLLADPADRVVYPELLPLVAGDPGNHPTPAAAVARTRTRLAILVDHITPSHR